MAAPNNLYRQTPSRVEHSAAVDQQLNKLEEDIRKLKIEFDIFFNGSTKRPPLEARARLESQIKRMSDNRQLTFAQRYQLNTLVARFTSYRELWRRTLRARGDELIRNIKGPRYRSRPFRSMDLSVGKRRQTMAA